jgi:hypothetical protein
MQIGMVEGVTRIIGKSQGYAGLPVRDDIVTCKVGGENTPTMTTAWLPTPAEIAALNAGASVHVVIVGTAHPPIMVSVGLTPSEGDQNG